MSDAPQPDAATVAAALAAERREVLALLADLTRGHGDLVAAALDSNLAGGRRCKASARRGPLRPVRGVR